MRKKLIKGLGIITLITISSLANYTYASTAYEETNPRSKNIVTSSTLDDYSAPVYRDWVSGNILGTITTDATNPRNIQSGALNQVVIDKLHNNSQTAIRNALTNSDTRLDVTNIINYANSLLNGNRRCI